MIPKAIRYNESKIIKYIMGACNSNPNTIPESELVLASYRQIRLQIFSYTRGLKTRIKEVMMQSNVGGTIKKTVLNKVDNIHSNPIHTEVIIGASENTLPGFLELAKEIFEKSVDYKLIPYPIPELDKEARNNVVIEKTNPKLVNRKSSDAGDFGNEDDILANTALITNRLKNQAKLLVNVASSIPFLSAYTSDLKDEMCLLINEMPRVSISTRSLFHPYVMCTFCLYEGDELSQFKVCIEWKYNIPFDFIELFTMTGERLNDVYTLMQDKECIFVDARITKKFFEKESVLKAAMSKITEEPFVYHKMVHNKMTMNYLIKTFLSIEEKMALTTIMKDLDVTGVIAAQIIKMIKVFGKNAK